MTPRRVLILGYGRLGRAFCRLYHAVHQIRGVKRTPLPPGVESPCEIICAPIGGEAAHPHLAWADVVIFCPASGREGGRDRGGRDREQDTARYRETYLGNMEAITAWMGRASASPPVVILISSTGVYPRLAGVWSEERPIPVESPRQEVLLLTEQALIRSGAPFVILRCGGLYGEGRENFLWLGRKTELSSAELTEEPLSLVHQDDVCGVVNRVIESGVTREIFNVRDDSAFTRKTLYTMIAKRLGIPIVDRGPAAVSADRQIPNDKLKQRLGYQFSRPPITAYLST